MVSNLSLGGFMVVVVVLGCFRGWFYFFFNRSSGLVKVVVVVVLGCFRGWLGV